MKYKIFDKPKPTDTVLLKLLTDDVEPSIIVVDEHGDHKYSLLGLRTDGTFVSYSGSPKEKQKDGFKTNNVGQILFYARDAHTINNPDGM